MFVNINEKDWIMITEGLKKKRHDGTMYVEGLMRTGNCPICGTVAKANEKGDMEYPFVFDKETLSFKTLCCSVSGGPCNFVMATMKMNFYNAIKNL